MSNEDFGGQSFRDKPDMSMIWLRHMDRTNLASGNFDGMYDAYVEQQLNLLPASCRIEVLSRSDEYTDAVEEYVYEYRFGRKRGSETKPLLYDELIPVKRYEDGSIDWTDPNIRSPKKKQVEQIDYQRFNSIILNVAEQAGLSWKTEPTNSEYGLYPEDAPEYETEPTPLDDPKKNEFQELSFLRKPKWILFKGKPKRVTNYLGYACGVSETEKPWFFSEIKHRQKKQKPIVILVTGTQGTGKTYTAVRLAEILDKRFNPDHQIAMDRSQITKLVSGRGQLSRNQAIIIDESQFGANARSWANKDQQALMNFLAAARFYGYVIFIVALHRSMLDSIIRERIVNFHIHMEDRGVSTIYEPRHARFDESNYPARKGQLVLQLPDYDACEEPTCLTCKKKSWCKTIRARYERLKTEFVQSEAEAQDQLEQEIQAKKITTKDIASQLEQYVSEVELTRQGYYSPSSIIQVASIRLSLDVKEWKARQVRDLLMKTHPPSLV